MDMAHSGAQKSVSSNVLECLGMSWAVWNPTWKVRVT